MRAYLWIALLVIGCGSKEGGGKAGDKAPPAVDARAELAAVAAKAVPEVNARLPDSLRGKLEFVAVLGEKDHHIAVQPKGWTAGNIPGSVKPPDDAQLGFMTGFSTGTNCDGTCEPKPWDAVSDKVSFQQFKRADFTVDKDEKLDHGRLLVAHTTDRVYIVAAFWKDGARRYFTCDATLDQEIAAAAPAFEQACRAMKILAWD